MNISGKTPFLLLFLAATMLASCSSSLSTPAMSDAEIMETAAATVSTTPAETQRAIPTNTPRSLPTFSLPTKTPTVLPGPTGTPVFPAIESFVGIWHNTGSNPEGWPKIVIASDGDTLFANVREACELPEYWTFPTDCDGGFPSARYSGNPVLMMIDSGSETYNFTLSLNGDILHVTTLIDYTDTSGRADETHEDDFRKEVPSFPLSEQIVFYHFDQPPYHGRVGAIRTPIFLFSAEYEEPYTSATATDLRTALEIVLHDERNGWISSDLEIVDVTFRSGHADIVLQGEYSGESDEVLSAAGMQILLTVFANPSVQTAAVTLNEDTIGNLGLSSTTNARPPDYAYTRAEMETYLIEHDYSFEYGEFLDR